MNFIEKLSYPSEKVIRTKPSTLRLADEHLFQAEFEKNLPHTSPAIVDGCYVLPNSKLFKGLLINAQQFNINPGFKGLLKSYLRSILSLLQVRKATRLTKALYVTSSTSHNFFHWFLDVLQILEFVDERCGQISDLDIKIVLPNSHNNSFVYNSLGAFNFDFYRQNKGEIIIFDELILLPNIAPTGNYRKDLVLELRDRLREYWVKKNYFDVNKKRIYITRKNSAVRRIINEDEIFPLLKKHGFSIVDFDLLDFEEQLSCVLGCEILISLHGAGLTHMLWMRENSKVLEIRARDDCHNNCYFTLASDLGHDYSYALADKTDPQKITQVSDFIIDPDHLMSQILKML